MLGKKHFVKLYFHYISMWWHKLHSKKLALIGNLEKNIARSGIRTHAHRGRLRAERRALDHSAILTHMYRSQSCWCVITSIGTECTSGV